MLRLLLCLSSSANQSKNYVTPLLNNEEKVTLTWEDVIKDDPLEGDHWKTWSEDSSNDDYSDDDGYEFEERNITTVRSILLFLISLIIEITLTLYSDQKMPTTLSCQQQTREKSTIPIK